MLFSKMVLACSFLLTVSMVASSSMDIVPMTDIDDHHFPVSIGAVNHIVQGRISMSSEAGSLVPSNVVIEGETDADPMFHLQVEIRNSSYTRPHVFHPDIKVDTSDPSNPQFEHPLIEFQNSTLPHGMRFEIVNTNAFVVNKDRFIVVNDFSSLESSDKLIHFDVILKDTLASETKYVSNHLPFVIEVYSDASKPNPNAALFAGVLIVTIVAISLIIPFVVRAKRRAKAGKPICGCGSADDTSDSDSTGSIPDYKKNRAMSIGGKDNLAMILDNGRLMHHRPSVDQHTTIQEHMLRSTSSMHFQPHLLDPHYRDVYDRPDFSRLQPTTHKHTQVNGSTKPHINGNQAKPAASNFLHGALSADSTRSSISSNYDYPPNFNKQWNLPSVKTEKSQTNQDESKGENKENKTTSSPNLVISPATLKIDCENGAVGGLPASSTANGDAIVLQSRRM